MAHSITIRWGIACSLSLLLTGCFWGGSAPPSRTALPEDDPACLRSPSRCIYKGSYEPGERAYAEDEARRLNQAQLDRLRRSGG